MKKNLVNSFKKLLVAFGGAEKVEEVKDKNLVTLTDKIAEAATDKIRDLQKHPIKFITFTTTENDEILEANITVEEIFEIAPQQLIFGSVLNKASGEIEYLYLARVKEDDNVIKFENFCNGLETFVYYDATNQVWKIERV